jgi:hypothetical protein
MAGLWAPVAVDLAGVRQVAWFQNVTVVLKFLPLCHHVPGHQLRDIGILLVPVPPDHGLAPDPLVQLLHRHRRAVLVDKAEPHAQRDDDSDNDGVGEIAGQASDRGRHQ